MKKFTYLVIATAALSMVACTGGNKAGNQGEEDYDRIARLIDGVMKKSFQAQSIALADGAIATLVLVKKEEKNEIQPLSPKVLLPLKVHKILWLAAMSLAK